MKKKKLKMGAIFFFSFTLLARPGAKGRREPAPLNSDADGKQMRIINKGHHETEKKRPKSNPAHWPRNQLPKPAVPTPVAVLASHHSATHSHLLLPSRPELSRKPPLEFVLIPRSRSWPRSSDAPRPLLLKAGGQAGTPQGLRVPGFFCFLSALRVSKADPGQSPLALGLAATSSLSAHARDVLKHRGAHGGKTGPSRQRRQVAP